MFKSLIFGRTELSSRTVDFGIALLRATIGLMMAFGHGLGKMPPSEQFIAGVAAMNFPIPVLFAWLAALSEFLGGILVAMGLATRGSSFLVGMTMGVAAFVRHADDPFATMEMALVYLLFFLVFLMLGGGRFSLDQIVAREN